MPRENIIYFLHPGTYGKSHPKPPAGSDWSQSCEGSQEEKVVLELGQSAPRHLLFPEQ